MTTKTTSHFLILVGLLCLLAEQTLAASADGARLDDQLRGAPKDIVALTKRELQCRHWSGVEISNEATDAMVARALGELKCDALGGEIIALRRKYAQIQPALRALDAASDILH
jgi:hypothetical protein